MVIAAIQRLAIPRRVQMQSNQTTASHKVVVAQVRYLYCLFAHTFKICLSK